MRVPLPAAMITMSSAMQHPCSKTAIIGVLLLFTTLLSGCGALRLAYGQAPDLVYWWLDGHADFTDPHGRRIEGAGAIAEVRATLTAACAASGLGVLIRKQHDLALAVHRGEIALRIARSCADAGSDALAVINRDND